VSDLQPDRPRLRPALPSLNFLLILLVFTGLGAALWHGVLTGRFVVFVFVLAGWVVSLCLHEFGHAVTAYWGGDHAVAKTGYLDLDPARYTDPALSIVLPIAYILIGGIGLPGGAVYIRTGMLRSRGWAAFVSAAGPLMNLAFLAAIAAINALLPPDATWIAAGLGALALFQATAIVLNLLPFPGLDGFGVVRPFLSRKMAIRADQIGGAAFLILFLLIWLTPVGGALLRVGIHIAEVFGFELDAIGAGFSMLKLF
jgi:Zn-dependent proteases